MPLRCHLFTNCRMPATWSAALCAAWQTSNWCVFAETMWDEIVKWRGVLLMKLPCVYRTPLYSHVELKDRHEALLQTRIGCFCAAVGAGEDCARQRRVFPESELVAGQGPVVGKAS